MNQTIDLDVPRLARHASRFPEVLLGLVRRSVLADLSRLEHGSLTIVDPYGRTSVGEPGAELAVTIIVHDRAAYWSLALGGSVGASAAYARGQWSADDLPGLARLMCENLDALSQLERGTATLADWWNRARAFARPNSRSGSRRNIAHHYDLSNEFFELFLDRSMTYSCGLFSSASATLEEAQEAKIDRICRKLDLGPGDHLLEIGTGWGALAMHAAKEYGCRVTTTTISERQWAYTKARAEERGLSDRIEFLRSDYRDLTGRFDKIVSVEMVEAIGHAQLETFFRTCGERLLPGGMALVQAITIRDQCEAAHRDSVDFIKRYIYPGSSIPSVTTLVSAATRASDLTLFHLEDMTPHYERTLRVWRERLLANGARAKELGFDDAFQRMWEYYLAYCEGGFAARYLGSVSMLFTKPGCEPKPVTDRLPMSAESTPARPA